MESITIERIDDVIQKHKVMLLCDSVYSESVVCRQDFVLLFKKIHDNGIFLLARGNSDIVGYAVVYANDMQTREAYITLICIRNEFQGCGLGHQLITACIDQARNQGMTTIRLAVLKKDIKQQGFYVKQGFEFCGETEDSLLMFREI